jgi:hypothetical protein
MYNRVASQPDPSSRRPTRYTPETLRHIGIQVEALVSQHGSLKIHKRAIERQLTAIAARISKQDGVLNPHNIFLLLEIRGSGGVSAQLEQIAHIVHEHGYWKPQQHVQDYHRQDVYYLGKSVQKLFDDDTALDWRVEQLRVRLGHIKQLRHMASEMTPTQVFECLAASNIVPVQSEVDAVAQLLEQANHSGWFWWSFSKLGKFPQ